MQFIKPRTIDTNTQIEALIEKFSQSYAQRTMIFANQLKGKFVNSGGEIIHFIRPEEQTYKARTHN